MKSLVNLVALSALALSVAGVADAKPCKDPATGKFVQCAASVGAPAQAKTTAASVSGTYALDASGRCRDTKGHMAKKSLCAGQTATATTSVTTPARAGAVTTTRSTTTTSVSTSGPHCVKGKRCGNACISVKDVCHKP